MVIEPRVPATVGTLHVHPITLDDMLRRVDAVIRDGERISIMNVNAHAVCIAEDDPEFRAAVRASPLVFCDGKAVQWASRSLGNPLPERFTPPDWIDRLCELAAANCYGMFFLGGPAGIASRAADRLTAAHRGLKINSHHGYFDKQGPENEAVIELINDLRPQLLLVGFGMPLQELWISANLDRLSVNVAFSVGALFDFVSGAKARGPRWLTDRGLEWLTRLVREPRRLGRRYLLDNPRFVSIVLRQKLGLRDRT
ncbi:MAG: WecB/TagA/CpsF family glycosyltransferase [Gemmatimonadota bacterium]